MKILILSELFHPHGSGDTLATYLYTKLLGAAGHDLVIVTHRFPGEPVYYRNDHIEIYRVPIFGSGSGYQQNKYATLRRIDIILAGYLRNFIEWADVVYIPRYWYTAIPLSKLYHKPVVVHSHNFLPICPLSYAYDVSKNHVCVNKMPFCFSCIYRYEKSLGRKLLESFGSSILNGFAGSCFNQVVKLSDAVVAVSESQRKIMVKTSPVLNNKVHTIYNPLPPLSFMDLMGDDFGYFGSYKIQKGFSLLCKALAYYNARANSTAINIHATCFDAANRKFVAQLKQSGIIAYGRVDEVTYNRLFETIRAVIVPSVWPEVYGYVAPEAFLRGRLVIASSIGGLAEVTAGCPGAFMFQPGDYRQLADQIQLVQSLSRDQATDLGAKNRAAILKKYNNTDSANRLINLFAAVIDKYQTAK